MAFPYPPFELRSGTAKPLPRPQSVEVSRLPAAKTPWAFWYVPDTMGGLGYSYASKRSLERIGETDEFVRTQRKYGSVEEPRSQTIGTLENLHAQHARLNSAGLSALSPLEKWALLSQDHDRILNGIVPDHAFVAAHWWGNCDGVAKLGIALPEPRKAVRRILADGRTISFSPADIKALAANVIDVDAFEKLGSNDAPMRPEVFDENLRNRLAKGQPLYLDIGPGEEMWNTPVVGYQRRVESVEPSQTGSRERIEVTLEVASVDAPEQLRHPNGATTEAVRRGDPHYTAKFIARYVVERDGSGRVVGGRWWHNATPRERIDYLGFLKQRDGEPLDLITDPVIRELFRDSL